LDKIFHELLLLRRQPAAPKSGEALVGVEFSPIDVNKRHLDL
jgi:hypothetical protein